MDERIHMKIVDIDESGQWLGSLAIGRKRLNLSKFIFINFRIY